MAKAEKKTWFRARALKARAGVTRGEVQIFSEIGMWGVTAMDFSDALRGLGKVDELSVRISSDGGDVSAGFAIFNMLARHPAYKVVTVEGLAASMASVIAMAGDSIVMPSNSMMMIHNPWGGVVGESDQIQSFADALQKMQDQIVAAYVNRTGMSAADVQALMDKETWLNAEESVELGFADTVEAPLAIAAKFDTHRFTRVPASFGAQHKESTMNNKPKGADTEEESGDPKDGIKSEATIRAEILASQNEIRSLCAIAGKPELAEGPQGFIAKGTAPALVLKALAEAKAAAAGEGGETNARHSNGSKGTGDQVAAVVDATAIYARYNKRR